MSENTASFNTGTDHLTTSVPVPEIDVDFEQFFELHLDLLCITDFNGRFIKINKSWEETLGYMIEELVGRSFLDFVHPDDIAATLEKLSDLENKKTVLNFMNRYRSKDGVYKYIEWRSHPYKGLIYAAARDITEKINTEKKLMASEANFRTFFDTVDDILIVANMHGDLVYANSAAIKKLGYSNDELLRMQVIDLNSEQQRTEAREIFADMMAGKRTICPISLQRKDGTLLPAESRIWFGLWNGQPSIFGVSKDLTVQQAALDRFYKLFHLNPTPMAISALDDGRFIDVNSSFLRILGYDKNEVIGKTSEELNLFADNRLHSKLGGDLRNIGSIQNYEQSIRAKDGRFLTGLFSGTMIDNQLDKVYLTVMLDITELRLAENEITMQAGLLLSLLNSIPDIVFYKDTDFIYRGCNPAHAAHMGKTIDEIIGRTDYELFSKDIADRFRAEDLEVMNHQVQIHAESWVPSPDGCMALYDTMKTPYRGLDGSVIGVIGIGRDITERKQRESEIEYISHHDQLTGLYNRRYFEDKLIDIDTAEHIPLSVIIGDINGLKLINDTFGHAEGDKVLKETANILTKCCRSSDIVTRIGGDEFCILMPNTNAMDAQMIVSRIKKSCEEFLRRTDKESYFMSISLGYETKMNPDDSIQTVIKTAEEFMYRRKLFESKSIHSSIITSIKTTLHEKSDETEAHAQRIAELSKDLGRVLKLPADKIVELELLASLHDIGKITIDDSILTKTEKLTDEEWFEIKKHPEVGYRITQSLPELIHISDYILYHHERWDGNGYPHRLSGENIPLLSRILSIVDSYDAMTQDRSYRKAMTKEEAILEIKHNAGTQFDPIIAEIFIEKLLLHH